MLDKLKTAVVLVIIAAASGLFIFGTYELTKDDIDANHLELEQSFYKEIFSLEEDVVLLEELTKNDIDQTLEEEIIIEDIEGTVYGYIYKGSETNSYGDITVLIGINLDGTIARVIISSTTNTPTFVNIIMNDLEDEVDFVDPFIGQHVSDVQYDGKTGASYTYGSVKKFVQAAVSYYNENRGDAS